MWYALIADGDITGFTTIKTDYPLPDGLIISDIITPAEQDAARAWLIAEGVIAAPVVDLPAERERARAAVIAALDVAGRRITSRYPATEVASWPLQDQEARAVVNGGAVAPDVPLIAALAAAFEITLAEMAAAVLAKAGQYRAVVAAIIATRDSALAAIEAAPDLAAIRAAEDTAIAAAGQIAV